MSDIFKDSVYLGVLIILMTYGFGELLRKKLKLKLLNPLLISATLSIIIFVAFKVDYEVCMEGTKYISYLLTPATICLAVPLYEQFELLKKNVAAVIIGICSGVLTSLCSVLALSIIFRLDHKSYVTFLPKSITTAIGMDVSKELGGYVSITVAVIVITGILGNIFAEIICKLFKIEHPIAKGIAIGSSAHALGTAKAIEMGEIEGAMSSLSIVVAGILTVIGSVIFAGF